MLYVPLQVLIILARSKRKTPLGPLGLVLGLASSWGLFMFQSVAVCEFPPLQRPCVAPEALRDTSQVFPLSRHTLSTFQSGAKRSLPIKPGRTHAPQGVKGSSTTKHLRFNSKAIGICWSEVLDVAAAAVKSYSLLQPAALRLKGCSGHTDTAPNYLAGEK